jgi:hypothetical protein
MEIETYSITWFEFKQNTLSRIDMFEDPVYSTYVDKNIFVEMYSTALETLDGGDMSSFVDFYFQSSPINNSIYIFRDENSKLDFMDIAIDCGLLPELEDIMAGETKQEKLQRTHQAPKQQQKPKLPKIPKTDPISKRTQQCENTLKKLMQKLQKETNLGMRTKIQQKIEQTLKHVEKSV